MFCAAQRKCDTVYQPIALTYSSVHCIGTHILAQLLHSSVITMLDRQTDRQTDRQKDTYKRTVVSELEFTHNHNVAYLATCIHFLTYKTQKAC